MNIPNTNPIGNTVTAPAAKAPITPKTGPVLAERKVQAAKKSVMTVDARLYGVKPTALSKYINDMIKVTPFSGVVYNKTMLSIVKQNAVELKQTRQGIYQIHAALLAFNVDFFKSHQENIRYLKELIGERELPNKPNLTSETLGQLLKIEKDNRRDIVRGERGRQSQTTSSGDSELDETNKLLKKILEEGKKDAKDAKKSGGGLMGFLKHPIKFIWDMLGSIPGGRLIGGLAAAAGIGAILKHILPNTLKALYNMFVPQGIKDFFTGVQEFFSVVKNMASDLWKNPMKFFGDRIVSIGKLLYDMFDNKFIKPIVYEVQMAGANIQAFIKEPFNLEKREAKLAELTQNLVRPSDVNFDLGKALGSILTTGTYSDENVKTVRDEKYTKPMQGINLSKGTNIANTDEKVLTNLYAMGLRYNEITGKSIDVGSASRNWDQQKAAYDAAVKKRGPESTWGGKTWATNPEKYAKSYLFHTKAFDISSETVKSLSKIIDPNTNKPLLESFGFERPMGYEPWHIQATKTGELLPRTDYDIDAMNAESGNIPSNLDPLSAVRAAISPPTENNAIKQTTDQINQYALSNYNYVQKYYSDSLNLQQQTVNGLSKLIAKPSLVSQNVNAPQLGPVTR